MSVWWPSDAYQTPAVLERRKIHAAGSVLFALCGRRTGEHLVEEWKAIEIVYRDEASAGAEGPWMVALEVMVEGSEVSLSVVEKCVQSDDAVEMYV